MKTKLYLFIVSIQLLLHSTILAQTENIFTVRGVVKDSITSETLVGVNVYLKDTREGTVTDPQGIFRLNLSQGSKILVISYIGYVQQEIRLEVNADISITIFLAPDVTELEEVKITAQRKFFGNMEYGREIPTIGAHLIERQNSSNASDILHARLAGVWATKTSGAPGDHQKIRIRGQSSFFSSAEPLYVVDGVPVPIVNLSSLGIADLNIHDIENVTVLKDASSSSLYGFQGGNGVVLIETKRGGKNQIDFSSKIGFSWFDNYYDLMSANEQLNSFDSAYSKLRIGVGYYYPNQSDTLCNRDWQDYIFKQALSTENQLSASGTFKKFNYFLSGSYLKQSGIYTGSEYERYTLAAKLKKQFFKRLAVEIGYRGSNQVNTNNQNIYKGNRLIFEGAGKSPCLECTPDSLFYNQDGYLNQRIYYDYLQLNYPELPQKTLSDNNHTLNISTHAVNLSARYQITDHLSLNALGSSMYRHSLYDLDYSYYYYQPYGTIKYDILLNSTEEVILINHQYNISYTNTFKDHDINLIMAYRFYEDNLWWQVDTLKGNLNNYSYLRNSMAAYGVDGSVLRKMNSYVGNASYNYKKKYFLSLVSNVSRITEGVHIDYYAVFPSVAFSWDLSKEKVIQRIESLNNLNLFINWGKSGNYPLNGLANDLYRNVDYTYGTNELSSYPAVAQFANHYLKHESTTETNIGLDIGLIKDRLSIIGTRFLKNIDNLIIQREIPYYYGGGKQYVNVGNIEVVGYDLTLEAYPVMSKNFNWLLNINASTSVQKIDHLFEGKPMSFQDNDILIPTFIIQEGSKLGDIYGYKCLGKWTSEDDANADNRYLELGGMKFLNADTTNKKLDKNDKVIIGNSIPKWMLNFSNSLTYRAFSLDIVWFAALNIEKFNSTRAGTIMAGTNREVNEYINDSISAIKTVIFYQSSEFIDDASFIRLKALTIGYEPNEKLFNHVNARFSLSFENLITLTKYRGYDPEATIFTDNNFSDNAIDKGAVPNPKSVYLTVGLRF